jgi:hypothetical protein
MGGNRGVRGIVLLRASRRPSGRADAGSRDVGDLRGHHWSVAGHGRECAGLLGSGVDRRSKESRSAVDVSPPRAVAAFYQARHARRPRAAPARTEGLNMHGIFRFPIELYLEQLLPSWASPKIQLLEP